ncbi:hypothetical protein PIIN_06134 [Serendipita indica DSM 11827]|uniref:Uncharacterized protein n=1 Tax=Serendipita indica (strain DSM 11827) TaxID=1109443 RepID=G4TLK6_SERID|nr:hypothetical protein PIIN_06134 [Serendipita indica DSM 11827]
MALGSYSVKEVVLDRSWDGFQRWHQRAWMSFSKFIKVIQALDTPECPDFDRHLVRFGPGVKDLVRRSREECDRQAFV